MNRPAALALASAAIGTDGRADLRDVLAAVGIIPTPVRRHTTRQSPRYRAQHPRGNLRSLSDPGPTRPQAPYGPCPVGVCENPAPSPGWPCGECVAALGEHLRPCVAGAAA